MEYIIITKTKITFQVVEDSIVLFLSKFDAKCSPLEKDDLYGYKIIVSAVKHNHSCFFIYFVSHISLFICLLVE